MPPLMLKNPQALQEMIGSELGVTEWFQITQERIRQFAEATEDRQWIHVNRERASQESPYGTTIAHGFLTLSLIGYFVKELINIQDGVEFAVNYGLNRVRFPAPVPSDSKIRARILLLACKELPDSIEATFTVIIENDHSDKPSCVAEWIIRYYG
ncbi:MAG TPA: MaoC family dehydratase [Verrucomicrobiae bacterium]|jgi:acyl dehydratase|nr:MaoC family dehydratase [Verrucomicrobiae bacterium]